MQQNVKRVYVEKRPGFDVEAQGLLADLRDNLGIGSLESLRILNRYDIAGLTEQEYIQAKNIIFAEPPVDYVYDDDLPGEGGYVFAVEYLPGQYDQRADSAAQCVQLLTQKERPVIVTAKVYMLYGDLTPQQTEKVKQYLINPVEAREASLDKPASLDAAVEEPEDVPVLEGFIGKSPAQLAEMLGELGLAMSLDDLKFCQQYFRDEERRDPTLTEIKVIDTYWSDHCRHTTFLTAIDEVGVEEGHFAEPIRAAYEQYLQTRQAVYKDEKRDICLMDIAVLGMKEMKRRGLLNDLDESEEINACSIVVPVDVDGRTEEWLVMFKNETHNHPTEIEPFGGAATCLGGAIRDPLSGRSYVYQAMRVTGSGDPRAKIEDTLPGKLPQRKITIGAAQGYSSYGNQIGLATGQVVELYHEGYVAKRMEIGAVIGAAPRENVVRKSPESGDFVILLGGRTGRDGCGGATGSSKAHTEESLVSCGAEVQKGNPPTERKIQRLFRDPKVSRLIKKCNDFGAGGVSVSIGELTDGIDIDLDAVPKKYEGLNGTELAISESQERMSVVVAPEDAQAFIKYAEQENLEATIVAKVTDNRRLKMSWRGKAIVDISRDFLDTNGVRQHTGVFVKAPAEKENYFTAACLPENAAKDLKQAWLANLQDLNVCSQKGLVERFDSTIGAATVLMPFGGKLQATPAEGMVAKIPVLTGETNTVTMMSFGYNPYLAEWSPFHGAVYALVEAVAKITVMGGDYRRIRLSLQEYFEKLGSDSVKWGKPFSALLGALYTQLSLEIPAIGGKDSMSGTFKDLNVPPTLVAFAVGVGDARAVISPEFKEAGSQVVAVPLQRDEYQLPDFTVLKRNYLKIYELIQQGKVLAAQTVRIGGIAAAVSKMCFGNDIGFEFSDGIDVQTLFSPDYGTLVLEIPAGLDLEQLLSGIAYRMLGRTTADKRIVVNGCSIELNEAYAAWEQPLEKIFPTKTAKINEQPVSLSYNKPQKTKKRLNIAKPRVFIPVFPGTNCEYDSARAFEQAGGVAETLVIRNLTPHAVEESIEAITKRIRQCQIIMFPGGFSAGDEPDGSGKFIAAMFRNPKIKEAVTEFLNCRDGLILGICNGFQALIKLGLVPYGEIVDLTPESPTLTYNKIGRHVSCMVNTKIVSNLSPWFNNVEVGDIHTVAISHGEGRFVAPREVIDKLWANGQIATQYVDAGGQPSNDIRYNSNGSMDAIEGITSPDGRILGKMGHSERIGHNVAKNVPGNKDQRIFAAGIDYFR